MNRILLEVAVDSVDDAIAAARAGADRLELCSALDQHGLSPSIEFTREVVQSVDIPAVAMVRPSAAGFVHTEPEWREHLRLAEELLAAGASGVVFGCLGQDGRVDPNRCRQMVRTADGRETVFHRAVDLVEDHASALQALADSGVTRVLTAGMTPAATRAVMKLPNAGAGTVSDVIEQRLTRLAEIVRSGRQLGLQTIICGGIRAANVQESVRETGAEQAHSSCRVGAHADFDPQEVVSIAHALTGSSRS